MCWMTNCRPNPWVTIYPFVYNINIHTSSLRVSSSCLGFLRVQLKISPMWRMKQLCWQASGPRPFKPLLPRSSIGATSSSRRRRSRPPPPPPTKLVAGLLVLESSASGSGAGSYLREALPALHRPCKFVFHCCLLTFRLCLVGLVFFIS